MSLQIEGWLTGGAGTTRVATHGPRAAEQFHVSSSGTEKREPPVVRGLGGYNSGLIPDIISRVKPTTSGRRFPSAIVTPMTVDEEGGRELEKQVADQRGNIGIKSELPTRVIDRSGPVLSPAEKMDSMQPTPPTSRLDSRPNPSKSPRTPVPESHHGCPVVCWRGCERREATKACKEQGKSPPPGVLGTPNGSG